MDLDLSGEDGVRSLGGEWNVIFFVVASLVLNLVFCSLVLPCLMSTFCLTLVLAAGVPFSGVARKVVFPALVAGVLMITQTLTYGRTPMVDLRVGGLTLTLYREGFLRGSILMGRVMAGVMLLIFLVSFLPVHRLLGLLGRLGIPRLLLLQCLMVYRFTSLLIDEASRIHEAQTLRLGFSSFSKKVRSLQMMGASLVTRSLDRSQNVYDAARMRGLGTVPPRQAIGALEQGADPRGVVLLGVVLCLFSAAGWVFRVAP